MRKGMILSAVCIMAAGSYFLTPHTGRAGEIEKGSLGVGLNYPGVGLRYFPVENVCVEARFQYEEDAYFGGGRLVKYWGPLTGVFPYLGLEAGYAGYKGTAARAGGYAVALFAGGEYFVWPSVSTQFDFGPGYVGLTEDDMSFSVSGVEFIINFGMTYYFGR